MKQLVQQRKDISPDLAALYTHHTSDNTCPSLTEFSRALGRQIPLFREVFIVVDALDECPDNARITFLDELQKLSPRTRLLVTSRPNASLNRKFADAALLEIRARDEDIKAYLEAWIDKQALWVGLVKKDPILRDTICAAILRKADGM